MEKKFGYSDPVEDATLREFGCSGGEYLPDELFERYEAIEDPEERALTVIFDQILAEDDDPVI